MKRLKKFIKLHWEEGLIWAMAVNLIAWSLTTGKPVVIIATMLSVIAVIILVYIAIERAGRRKEKKIIGENTAFKVARQGIIFTVGKQTDTIAFALEEQHPDLVGFICSAASQGYVDDIVARFSLNEENYRKYPVSPFDIHEIIQISKLLIGWMLSKNHSADQLVVDVTGGMTTMSVGAFSAAEDSHVDSQYIRSKYDDQNKVVPGTMEGVFITHFPDRSGEPDIPKG
jgi:hypothetical protein